CWLGGFSVPLIAVGALSDLLGLTPALAILSVAASVATLWTWAVGLRCLSQLAPSTGGPPIASGETGAGDGCAAHARPRGARLAAPGIGADRGADGPQARRAGALRVHPRSRRVGEGGQPRGLPHHAERFLGLLLPARADGGRPQPAARPPRARAPAARRGGRRPRDPGRRSPPSQGGEPGGGGGLRSAPHRALRALRRALRPAGGGRAHLVGPGRRAPLHRRRLRLSAPAR